MVKSADTNHTAHSGAVFTLIAPVTTAAYNSLFLSVFIFSEKLILDISCESSRQMIHMKCEVLFSLKNPKGSITEYRPLQLLLAL